MKRIFTSVFCLLLVFTLASCGGTEQQTPSTPSESTQVPSQTITAPADGASPGIAPPEEFVLISGGTFQMGSLESETWRVEDETAHTVTVSEYYISKFEVTQADYQTIMGENPSAFTGDDFPVESTSWMDAIRYCNARSTQEGLTPAYAVDGQNVSWDRSANGYRLPTEAEWEYACRAGTETPFNTETSISADEANYWGHYSYLIEDNYFS